jgi:hypothetical protein
MNAKQRRKKRHQTTLLKPATGPITPEGKEASRRNRLTHGLTAKVLTLPGEDPEAIQAQADRLHEDLQPEGHDEEVLVDQIALASLRLERIARAEAEILAEQVRNAETEWDLEQNLRLLQFRRLLRRDRATAILNLRSFGAGVSWLLGRWKFLEAAFNSSQCWNDLGVIREALLLRGFLDDKLDARMGSGHELAQLAVSCIEDHENRPELAQFLATYDDEGTPCVAEARSVTEMVRTMTSYIPDACLASRAARTPSVIEARRTMRGWIERQVADLRELDRHFREVDAKSRAGARLRAQATADTPRNRLLLRYMKSAETAFDRARKTLAKLQRDRAKADETAAKREASEARKVGLRNEPNVTAPEPSKELVPGSCVTMDGDEYVVVEKSDGHVILSLVDKMVESQPREVAATSENAA